MLMQITLPGVGPVNPLVLLIAFVAGLVAFFVFRLFFRALHILFHIGCLALVAIVAFFILRNIIH